MNRIKLLREEFKISQEELAEKLELSKGIISLYETESRKPSYEVLIKLSKIFNCSIDYIMGISDVRNSDNDFDFDKLRIGLSTKDYTNISDTQLKQIEDFARFVLKDNKKKDEEENGSK